MSLSAVPISKGFVHSVLARRTEIYVNVSSAVSPSALNQTADSAYSLNIESCGREWNVWQVFISI